ncbi:MAG: translation elongation factor-like protein [Promethearchaeota archaeon]|jgi:putative protease
MVERRLKKIGEVSHYYHKIGVAVIELNKPMSVGDRILISGSTTNIEQEIKSMQIEHKNIVKASSGKSVGLKVKGRVRKKDIVYKITQ